MQPQALPASAEQVTVTNTATDLLSLIRTASSINGFDFYPKVNFVVLQVDSASASGIRYSASYTPTATKGIEVAIFNSVEVPLPPQDIKLIRTGAANATVNVQVYRQGTID
jgi:hypothetical protein